jgi:hypothetical protein
MGNFRSPAEAGPHSERGRVGPDAVLGGSVFDPFDVPFLLPAELPVVYPKFAGSTGSVARGDGHTIGERKQPCPTQGVSNSTPRVASTT